jgi:hypothetical protein
MTKRLFFLLALFVLMLYPAPAAAAPIFRSGFESQANNTGAEWSAAAGTVTASTTWKRTGVYSLGCANNTQCASRKDLLTSVTSGTYFFVATCKTPETSWGVSTSDLQFCITLHNGSAAVTDSITVQPSTGLPGLCNAPAGTCSVTRGAVALSANTSYDFELRVVLSDASGELELRIYTDASPRTLVDTITVSGVDTLNTNFARVLVGQAVAANYGTGSTYYDDFVWNDSTGASENTYPIGRRRISFVEPVSDNSVTWTQTSCTGTNASCVNDMPTATITSVDTSFATTSAGSQTDRLNIDTLPAEIPSDADMISMIVFARMGGTGTTSTNSARTSLWDEVPTQNLFATWANACDINGISGTIPLASSVPFELGARSKADVQNFDIGYASVTVNVTCKTTALWAALEWTETIAGGGGGDGDYNPIVVTSDARWPRDTTLPPVWPDVRTFVAWEEISEAAPPPVLLAGVWKGGTMKGRKFHSGSTLSAGCGAGLAGIVTYDQSTCGPTGSDPYATETGGSQAAFQSGATALAACNTGLLASTRYYLTQSVSAADSATICFNFTNGTKLDLNGFTVTGRISKNGVAQGASVFNGFINCDWAQSGGDSGCLRWTNPTGDPTTTAKFHHLTIRNSICNGVPSCTSIAADIHIDLATFSSNTGVIKSVEVYNNDLLLTHASSASRNQLVRIIGNVHSREEVYNNVMRCGGDVNACQGIENSSAQGSSYHNNHITLDTNTTGTRARAIACDANAIPSGDLGCDAYNNYIINNNNTACRWRSRLGKCRDSAIVGSNIDSLCAVHLYDQSQSASEAYEVGIGLEVKDLNFVNPVGGCMVHAIAGTGAVASGITITGTPAGQLAYITSTNATGNTQITMNNNASFSASANLRADVSGTGIAVIDACNSGSTDPLSDGTVNNTCP